MCVKMWLVAICQGSAIDGIVLPVDIGAVWSDQESCEGAEVLCVSEIMHRNTVQDLLTTLVIHDFIEHLTVEPAWRDRVHSDVVVRPFDGETACEAEYGSFAGTVWNDQSESQVRTHAGNVDDSSFILAFFQIWIENLRHKECTLHVGV